MISISEGDLLVPAANEEPLPKEGEQEKGNVDLAPARQQEEMEMNVDLSQIRPSVDTGLSGIEQIVDILVGGSAEAKNVLTNECSVIFECKVCRALFRALPNLIAHKRYYCIERTCFNIPVAQGNSLIIAARESAAIAAANADVSFETPLRRNIIGITRTQVTEPDLQTSNSAPDLLPLTAVNSVPDRPVLPVRNRQRGVARVSKDKSETLAASDGLLTYGDIVDFAKKACRLCGINFHVRRHVVAHVREKHAKQLYMLKCPHCPQTFFINGNMTRHLLIKHGITAKASDVTEVRPNMSSYRLSALHQKKMAAQQTKRKVVSVGPILATNVPTSNSNNGTRANRIRQNGTGASEVLVQQPDVAKAEPIVALEQFKVSTEEIDDDDDNQSDQSINISARGDDDDLPLANLSSGELSPVAIRGSRRNQGANSYQKRNTRSVSLGQPPNKLIKRADDVSTVENAQLKANGRQSPRLNGKTNPSVSNDTGAPSVVFTCRQCSYSSANFNETTSHVEEVHKIRLRGRNVQPYIDVSNDSAPKAPMSTRQKSKGKQQNGHNNNSCSSNASSSNDALASSSDASR